MDELVGELTKLAPNLYNFFQDLGRTSEGDNVMAVMSLCTLLKLTGMYQYYTHHSKGALAQYYQEPVTSTILLQHLHHRVDFLAP
jgi:hypothetical protein